MTKLLWCNINFFDSNHSNRSLIWLPAVEFLFMNLAKSLLIFSNKVSYIFFLTQLYYTPPKLRDRRKCWERELGVR